MTGDCETFSPEDKMRITAFAYQSNEISGVLNIGFEYGRDSDHNINQFEDEDERECEDTSNGARDSGGDPCSWYDGRLDSCGRYDDSNFRANDMCCECDGGSQSQSVQSVVYDQQREFFGSEICINTNNGATDDDGDTCYDYY